MTNKHQRRIPRTAFRRLGRLEAQGKQAEAIQLLRRLVTIEPGDHWIWSRLSVISYECGRDQLAIRYSRKALDLSPKCPLVLWDYACALTGIGEDKKAIAVLKQLLRRGIRRIAHGECGEGIRWARSLILDCNYKLAWCYIRNKNWPLARRYGRAYLKDRSRAQSIFPKSAAAELSRTLDRGTRKAE